MTEIPYEPESIEPDPADRYLDDSAIDAEVLKRLEEADAEVVASETGKPNLDAAEVLARLAGADAEVTPLINEPNPNNQIRALPESEVAVLRELFSNPPKDFKQRAILIQAADEYRRGALTDVPEDIADLLENLPID